jgi:alpha,alpha-trehalase
MPLRVTALPKRFPPHVLRDYALIADGERGALIGPHGDISWLCVPRWEAEAVFATLIGGGGVYAISPADERYVWGGYYEAGTLIWRSRWVTADGVVECREAMLSPGDPHRAVILRRVMAIDHDCRMQVEFAPSAGYGNESLRDVRHSAGSWTARTDGIYVRWTAGPGARRTKDGLDLGFRLHTGESRDFVLELSDRPLTDEPPEAEHAWESTSYAWSEAVPDLSGTLAPFDARQAYAVLRGLTSHSGGMVAAATTSLPERAEAGRNYDYRYAWIRDQCYAGQAVAAAGHFPLLDGAVRFIADRLLADGRTLKPGYTVDGGPIPAEHQLAHVVGYPGGGERVGNKVNEQFQLDTFGEALMLFATAAEHDRLATEHWRAVEIAVDAIQRRWSEPDAGIWELDNERWTHSRLTCVAGLRAIGRYAAKRSAAEWTTLADSILGATARDGLHPSGRWQRSATDGKVDAALLLAPIRGAVPADDPRTLATIEAVRRELGEDHFIYRFRQERGPLARAEGAFILCGFWMALVEHQQGNAVSAARYFERNRAACGTPGLFSEEFDVDQRQLRGNLPQAFVHALLLEAAARLAR